MKEDNSGFVYLMVKESSPGFLKVGTTEKKPHLRAIDLDGTDSPTPSIVIYYIYCECAQKLERLAHAKLNGFRVRANREWFRCSHTTGIEAIKSVAASEEIEIFYENFLGLPAGVAEISEDYGDEMDDECGEPDIEKLIDEALDSIWFYHDFRWREVEKYTKYLEERKEELRTRSIGGEKGTDTLLSMSVSAYESKLIELRAGFDASVNVLIKNTRTALGDDVADKLLSLAHGIADGKITKISSSAAAEDAVAKVADTLIKKRFN